MTIKLIEKVYSDSVYIGHSLVPVRLSICLSSCLYLGEN